ncbi:hypothetical protein GBW32_27915 [Streptomyces tsukubensis]|nr:hypothetical protein GBW32_27915 [Streptomyces tsukubensis]
MTRQREGNPERQQVLLYENRVSTAGRLIVTTMDPVYHHGSRFMPGATELLYGPLRWTGADGHAPSPATRGAGGGTSRRT